MAKNAGRLAGLAALGAAAYMMSQGKGKAEPKGKEDTGPGYKSTETREADNETAAAYPSGIMGGARQKDKAEAAPVVKRSVKSDDLPEVKNADNANANAYPSGVMGGSGASDVPLRNTNIPIGGAEKRIEGNKPMPSLAAVERKAAARKASIATDEMKNRSRAEAAARARMKAMRDNPESQAVQGVYPEQFITPGGGVKTLAGMAKNLANRGTVSAAERAAPAIKEIGMSSRSAASTPQLSAPAKQLTGPSKADIVARDRAARAASRQEEMLQENASRYGLNPNAPGYEGAAGAVRRNLGGEDFSLGMKKGGAVKKMASGGMTASRRGDGIASRGKTRCKMY